MTRRFGQTKLLIASNNSNKASELRNVLDEFNVEVISASDLGITEPIEDGLTFSENALIKAKHYAEAADIVALADDSGLCIDALNGAPGIYSARWAGDTKDFNLATNRIYSEIEPLQPPTGSKACFVCALALYWPSDGHSEQCEGKVHGTLTFPARGSNGFGYDPIFIPDGYNQTFAEIDSETKQRISHRANALEQLISHCFR